MTAVAPLSADAYRQGRVYLGQRNYSAALESFRAAIRANPSDGNSYFYIGHIQERQGNKPAAIESYKRATGLNTKSDLREQAYWKVVLYLRHIEDWDALSVYAGRFLQFRRHSRVAQLKELADSRRDPRKVEVARLTASARKKMSAGEVTEAARLYERAVSIMPEDDILRWNFISTAVKADRHDLALKHLKVLERKHPNEWKYHYKSGVSEYNLGFYSDALQSFDRAEKINKKPNRAFRRYLSIGRGLTLLELDDAKGAYRELREAHEIKSSDAVISGLARAAVYLNMKEAAEYVALASKNADGKSNTYLARGLNSYPAGSAAVIRDLNDYLNHKETNRESKLYREVQLLLGYLYANQNQKDKAIGMLQDCPESDLKLRQVNYLYSKSHTVQPFPGKLAKSPVGACLSVLSTALLADPLYGALKIEKAPVQATEDFINGYYFIKTGKTGRGVELLKKSFSFKPYLDAAKNDQYLSQAALENPSIADLLEGTGTTEAEKEEPGETEPDVNNQDVTNEPENTGDSSPEKEEESVTPEREESTENTGEETGEETGEGNEEEPDSEMEM